MAGPNSFGKRENEKKKQAKRLEKQKRKEERQAGGTASMDDMIAWVDQNGNIIDTPPEHARVEVDIDSIEISTPRKESIEVEPLKGRVDYFDTGRGYGFIKDQASGEKYFFHISSAPGDIAEGNIVNYEIERGTRGMNAVRIKVVK